MGRERQGGQLRQHPGRQLIDPHHFLRLFYLGLRCSTIGIIQRRNGLAELIQQFRGNILGSGTEILGPYQFALFVILRISLPIR